MPKHLNFETADSIDDNASPYQLAKTAKFVTELLQKSKEVTYLPSIESDISQAYEKVQKILERDQQLFNEYCRSSSKKMQNL